MENDATDRTRKPTARRKYPTALGWLLIVFLVGPGLFLLMYATRQLIRGFSEGSASSSPKTLQEAIAAGWADATFRGTGASSGDSVMVEVSKPPKAAWGQSIVTIPAGSELKSSKAGDQSMVVLRIAGRVVGPYSTVFQKSGDTLREGITAVKYEPTTDMTVPGPGSGSATYLLRAFCSEFHKENPSANTHFTLGPPNPALACIAKQSQDAALSIPAAQAAVWMYTDRLTFDEMNKKMKISQDDWSRARQAVAVCMSTSK